MDKRSEVMQMFGPKLIEALVIRTLIEINILRELQGLPPRTKLQLYDEIINEAKHLPDYDWMKETP